MNMTTATTAHGAGSAAPATASFDTAHEDMIHDAQMDYYGRRLATCSSDRTIKIFEVATNGTHRHVADLKSHTGPVWQVAWAHPKFGSVLVSCGYDRRVIVWREQQAGQWTVMYEMTQHTGSVNSVAWAPVEFGLCFASCSSDASVAVCRYKPETDDWEPPVIFDTQQTGCNAVSWAPFHPAHPQKRLATAGCDATVKLWSFSEASNSFVEEKRLDRHTDWVRDVQWCPMASAPNQEILASAGQDKRVILWVHDLQSNSWDAVMLPEFAAVVWRLSWSITGNLLAVTTADNKVTLWKQMPDGEFKQIETPELEAARQE